MPTKSESQRRAMFAAKAGKSTLGIPKSVGKEFADADPGGKLPPTVAQPMQPEGLSTKIAKQRGPKAAP